MAEHIIDEVYGIRLGIANAFLLRATDGGVTLIDTGIRRRLGLVAQAVTEAFGATAELRHIVITHHHTDHTGSLDQLVALTRATVYVHAMDAPLVDGRRRRHWSRLIIPTLFGFGRPRPVSISPLSGGDVLQAAGTIRVIHTPGHTAGHVSLLVSSSRGNVLFAGDAAGEFFGRVGPVLPFTSDDAGMARASYGALREHDFELACFGHGKTIRSRAHRRFFGD